MTPDQLPALQNSAYNGSELFSWSGQDVGSIGVAEGSIRKPGRSLSAKVEPPLPVLDISTGLDEVYLQLSGGAAGVLVSESGAVCGIVTKADIVDVLAERARAGEPRFDAQSAHGAGTRRRGPDPGQGVGVRVLDRGPEGA